MEGLAKDAISAQQELTALRRVFSKIDIDGDGHISEDELLRVLARLKYRPKRGEVRDMIWEVDEDCDGHVTWAEFEIMFTRCRKDKAGLEPRKLYNLVEFMLHDKDDSGTVSFDECMEIMYRRFGKGMLEQRTKAFFAAADANGDNALDFAEFSRQMLAARIHDAYGRSKLKRPSFGKDLESLLRYHGSTHRADGR